jgi:hypothetical protein
MVVSGKNWPCATAALVLTALLVLSCGPKKVVPPGPPVKISNVEPRRDVNGNMVDAHDGCLQFFKGRFYLYGTSYGTNDGWGTANRYRVYSSPDLGKWTLEGDLLTHQPAGVYYRPYVVFNPNTKKYVLWYNWYPQGWAGAEGIAVSDTPVGPFTIVNTNVLRSFAKKQPGDGSLFVDDDGRGYYIFTAIAEDYSVRVASLTPDFFSLTGDTSPVLAKGAESPLMFRRNDLYYVLFGPLCAFCPEGSIVQVLTTSSPLGPSFHPCPNINRQGTNPVPIIPGQETWVAKIPTPDGPAFIWMADLWGMTFDGQRGHDLQFWSTPLVFSNNDDILPLKPISNWYIAGSGTGE